MSSPADWLFNFDPSGHPADAGGIVSVQGYVRAGRPPEEVVIMEKAKAYEAHAVFFEAAKEGKIPVAQAFIYLSDGPAKSDNFAKLHQKLWSWGGVPLAYRVTRGLVQLFRCAHRPDFEKAGQIVCHPFKTLKVADDIANDPWWHEERLRNGTLWDDPDVCKKLLSSNQSAQKTLINAVRELHRELNDKEILPKALRRKLLILSVLIAYLEKRQVFEDDFFRTFKRGATKFFQVLEDGKALVALLEALEDRFNGHVFELSDEDKHTLRNSNRLTQFANLIEGRREASGQLTLWERYSFADLPVELISHIYQLFVSDKSVAVYTPHFLVRMMLSEVLSWERLDRLDQNDEVILDGACGSGIFLVEAYKRLVLHWRYRNSWDRPKQNVLKKLLTSRIRGVDLEDGAVELAAFSLCLALCDALEPMEIRASVKLFPELIGKHIHKGCFFEAREENKIKDKVGVIVGNPPFASRIQPGSEQRAYDRYQEEHGELPDKQVAYLFLHESMEMLAPGGVLSMLQQYNFLYNQKSLGFRRKFIERWDVREILDFISVRGLFQKGGADTKVVVLVAEANTAPSERQILHATFRRSGRTDAEQGFDIDYYDMHWLPRELALSDPLVWRADLVGGGRVLQFVNRLKRLDTLQQLATEHEWDFGEGWIEGKKGKRAPAPHITSHPWLPSRALTSRGIDKNAIKPCTVKLFKSAYSEKRFTSPMLLVRSHSDFYHAVWNAGYLTYTQRIIGYCGKKTDLALLKSVDSWLQIHKIALQAFVAATSPRVFTQKSTALTKDDIDSLPCDPKGTYSPTPHESILAEDIVSYFTKLIRIGQKSPMMIEHAGPSLPAFNDLFTARIGGVYKKNKLRALDPLVLDGVICQPYVFGKAKVEWPGADELKKLKLDALLHEKRGAGLNVTRIARVYDGACIYLIKPDRLRYWLRSVALRDADETLADLSAQGF